MRLAPCGPGLLESAASDVTDASALLLGPRLRLGGRELAAIAGAIIAARHHRIPVLLDGYVATAAAAVLRCANSRALDHCLAAHCSAEPAHRALLQRIGKEPLLDLGMRLGEASGAALAAAIVKAAVETHAGMATFAEAGVSGKTP